QQVVVKHGPYGSHCPENYSMTLEDNESIKEVILSYGFIMDGIGFIIEKPGMNPIKKVFGGTGGDNSKIELKCGEVITQISGTSGEYSYCSNERLISSLKIHTNYRPEGYGPYGIKRCTRNVLEFASPKNLDGRIIGFCGNARRYLFSLGIYVKKDC
ncbi:Mannose/glucose-specific lectin, partial [Bienertia sinuspersici]